MQATLIYLAAPAEMRSRLYGVLSVCIGSGLVGFLHLGVLAELIGAPWATTVERARRAVGDGADLALVADAGPRANRLSSSPTMPERGGRAMWPKFRNPWWVVFGAVTGLFVCNGPVLAFTFGIFLKPIMADMGWQRGETSFALSFGSFVGAMTVPLLGRMMDRWSIRTVALPGIVIYARCSRWWA